VIDSSDRAASALTMSQNRIGVPGSSSAITAAGPTHGRPRGGASGSASAAGGAGGGGSAAWTAAHAH
jgi:hypothetical protein